MKATTTLYRHLAKSETVKRGFGIVSITKETGEEVVTVNGRREGLKTTRTRVYLFGIPVVAVVAEWRSR